MSRAAAVASNYLALQPLSFREIKSKLARETKTVQGEMEVKCLNSHSIRYYWSSAQTWVLCGYNISREWMYYMVQDSHC